MLALQCLNGMEWNREEDVEEIREMEIM